MRKGKIRLERIYVKVEGGTKIFPYATAGIFKRVSREEIEAMEDEGS